MKTEYDPLNLLTVRIMTWNTLAKQLATKDAFPFVSADILNWTNRRVVIETFLKKQQADIMCLQEVDYAEELLEMIDTYVFGIIYEPKSNQDIGQAIIYRKDYGLAEKHVFELFGDELKTKKSSQIALAAEMTINKRNVLVVNVHLKAKKVFEDTRKWQVSHLLKEIEDRFGDREVIICGDFNADPEEEAVVLVQKWLNGRNLGKTENLFSTFKIRDKKYQRLIDYIFTADSLVELGEQIGYAKEEKHFGLDEEVGYPNEELPSDHMPVFSSFKV